MVHTIPMSATLIVLSSFYLLLLLLFFFNDTATTEIYTLSLHDALPISMTSRGVPLGAKRPKVGAKSNPGIVSAIDFAPTFGDRKSTRLNSSHGYISYAVFCLKKKKKK